MIALSPIYCGCIALRFCNFYIEILQLHSRLLAAVENSSFLGELELLRKGSNDIPNCGIPAAETKGLS